MRQFFKFVFASMVGMILTFFIAGLLIMIVIGAMISSIESDKYETITEHSVLLLEFEDPIPDRGSGNPFENFNFQNFEPNLVMGLNEILSNIEKAKTDDNIKGIYLNTGFVDAGFATIEEIRDALMDFKKSGKFIYSYGEVFTQPSYYLATTADEIHMNPAGYFDLKGMSAQLMFFKGTMDKLEIKPQVIRHGKYKSAIEPFVNEKMSDENREQITRLVDVVWSHMVNGVSSVRNIPQATINDLANRLEIKNAEKALEHNFIDKISYEDEVIAALKEAAGTEEDDDLKLVKLSRYKKVKGTNDEKKSLDKRIAVIYASGEIREGESSDDVMGSETIAEAIRTARKDDKVKAIVLRVNSPGGSALASDIIWREMVLAKEKKPTVVSMGNLAASGGYYISCAANKIIASENTITGSIGVFGLVPNMQGLFNKKLGITIDTVITNTHADINTVFRPLTDVEINIITEVVDNIYQDFIQHVAEGRGLTVEKVDEIGQGRVWTGEDAVNIGLVDEIGGLERAIDVAAELAELGDDYQIKSYPDKKEPFEFLIKGLSEDVEKSFLKAKLGDNWQHYMQIERLINDRGIFARLPFEFMIQ